MDLEDLKAGWSVLNEQLEQNKILNERMVKEMIAMRTKSVYERLWSYELKNGILGNLFSILCVLPFIYFYLDKMVKHSISSVMSLPSFLILEAVVIGTLIFSCVALYHLSKFELNNLTICEGIKPFLKYKLTIRRGYLFANGGGAMAVIAYFWIENLFRIFPITILIGFVLGFAFAAKEWHFYQKNIKEVEQSMEELREFEA